MGDFIHHPSDGGRILMYHGVVETMETKGFNYATLVLRSSYRTFNPGDFYFSHNYSTICPVKVFGLYYPLGGVDISYRYRYYFLGC